MAAQPTWEQIYIRIDIFRQIKTLPATAAHQLNMPYNLYALKNMAATNAAERNRFNREYFKLYKTKYIKFPHSEVANGYETCHFNCRFPFSKKVTLSAGSPVSINGELGHSTAQSFTSNMPVRDVFYCMISTNAGSAANIVPYLNRFISYRDQHGTVS